MAPSGAATLAPSTRTTTRAHLVALAILVAETVYWIAQPCVGDFLCAPVVGFYTGIAAVPLFVAMVVRTVTGNRRSGALVAADGLLLGVLTPVSLTTLFGGASLATLPFVAATAALWIGVFGATAELARHPVERAATVLALLGVTVWLTTIMGPAALLAVVVPLGIALLTALRRVPVSRGQPSGDPLPPDESVPGAAE